MEQITLLLLAGWAAAIAAIAVTAVKGFSSVTPTTTVAFTHAPAAAIEEVPAVQPSETATTEAPAVEPISAPTYAVALAEAPPPFPEESHNTSSTSLPVDVTAVTNIANPTDIAAPVLVINTPKRRTRARRMPSDPNAPRRRRTPKAKAITATPTITATPGAVDQVSIPPQSEQTTQDQA